MATTITVEQVTQCMALHKKLDNWAEKVLLHALNAQCPAQFVVARVGTDGIRYLMDEDAAHFTATPRHAKRFDLKQNASKAMVRGYDIMKEEFGPVAASLYWRGQRIVPTYLNPYIEPPV